ncbi:MAG: hypothetical protein IJJ00_04525 [Erysipelotrichaceae bacterium]|nr:hypothetical protein [Erysipelotrichaceae bacterium]
MKNEKIVLGQFFTKDKLWLKPHIINFINDSHCSLAYDPFAGNGDLLFATIDNTFVREAMGLDIDKSLKWQYNDSLIKIPHIENAIIITNPPYLSSYSASRKGLKEKVNIYFNSSIYDDLYFIALDKMLEAQDYVVAIVPETFINSSYRQKKRLVSITVLEDNPFTDTECPVVVLCFDDKPKDLASILIYKNDKLVCNLEAVEKQRLFPKNNVPITFNSKNGWLAIKCVDGVNKDDFIRFDFKKNMNYDWDNNIKVSSRLFTLVNLDVKPSNRKELVVKCNSILSDLRKASFDLVLSPFKGNSKSGIRRRRLDYLTARAIIEKAYELSIKGECYEQH